MMVIAAVLFTLIGAAEGQSCSTVYRTYTEFGNVMNDYTLALCATTTTTTTTSKTTTRTTTTTTMTTTLATSGCNQSCPVNDPMVQGPSRISEGRFSTFTRGTSTFAQTCLSASFSMMCPMQNSNPLQQGQLTSANSITCSVCSIAFSQQLSGNSWTYTVYAGANYVTGQSSGIDETALDGYKLFWVDTNGRMLTEIASVAKSGVAASTSCCEGARYQFTVNGATAPAGGDRFMVVPYKGKEYLKVGKVTNSLLSAAFSSPTAITATAAAPVAWGATSVQLASIAGIVVGMKIQLSGGGNTESKTVIAVTPARRLSSLGRRLQAGSVTFDSPVTNSFSTTGASPLTIKLVVPPEGLPTTTTRSVTGTTTTVTGGTTTTMLSSTSTTTQTQRLATTNGATKVSVAAALGIVVVSSLLRM